MTDAAQNATAQTTAAQTTAVVADLPQAALGALATEALLLAAFLGPLAMAAALATPAAGWVLRALPLAALPALVAVAVLQVPAAAAEPWLLMGAGLGLEATGRAFLGFTAVLWAVAGWAAARWLRGTAHRLRFAACFLLAMAGNFGLILASDVPGFYTFFALMSFASYGLVIHTGSPGALAAGRIYIGFVVVGELVLFAGLALAVAQSGALAMADIRAHGLSDLAAALMILGLGVKLGVMPLHVWLPPAHGAAPAAASAVLSGAMIKAGLWGMMALLPLGVQPLQDHGTVLLAAGLVTLFAAVLLGLREASPKAVLGWSSVAQMGLVALGLGAVLKAPGAWAGMAPVLVLLAAHHALAKGALFLGAGTLAATPGRGARAVLLAGLALPALGLVGVAGSAGGWAKEALKTALGAGPAGWTPWLVLAITLAGVGTTLLMARAGWTLWTSAAAAHARAPARGPTAGPDADTATASPSASPATSPSASPHAAAAPDGGPAPFVTLAALALALPLAWPLLVPDLALALPAVGPPALWPVAVGAAGALTAMAVHHTLTVGPQAVWRRLTATPRRRWSQVRAAALRVRRALRVQGRRIPARLIAGSEAWRLAPAGPALALAVVLAVTGADPVMRALSSATPQTPPEASTEASPETSIPAGATHRPGDPHPDPLGTERVPAPPAPDLAPPAAPEQAPQGEALP